MRDIIASITLVLAALTSGMCQVAPNFEVTDINGVTHNLYTDYLDQGTIVVLETFFVYCPPCNSAAPEFQAKYVQWGSGSQGVQFIEMTNKVTDTDVLVQGFVNQHGLTMPAISAEGGGVQAQELYNSGLYGPFYGTPHYTVIAPDKTVMYDINFADIDDILTNLMGSGGAPSTPVSINTNLGQNLPQGISIMMKPSNANTPVFNITALTNGTYEFDYPSANFPEITDPVIYLECTAPAKNSSTRVGDLVAIRKHILGIDTFTDDKIKIAADVNGDNRIRVTDLVALRKVILGIIEEFPNDVPSFVMYPEEVPLTINGTDPVDINLTIIKKGNVN